MVISASRVDSFFSSGTSVMVDCTGAGDDVAHSARKNRMREKRGCAGTVTDNFTGLFGGLAENLRAKIFFAIGQVEFLGDGHPVVTYDRSAPFSLNEH